MNYKFKKETDYKISLQKAEEQEDIIKIIKAKNNITLIIGRCIILIY